MTATNFRTATSTMNEHASHVRPIGQAARPARRRQAGRATLARAHRRDHQRFRRRRAALRPVARRHRRARWATASGPSRSSPPKSSRRRAASPARAATASASARSRITNGGDETDLVVAFNEQVLLGRVRARRAQARLHHPAREHVARAPRPDDRRRPMSRRTTSSSRPATGSTRCRWSANAARSSPIRGAARTCSCSACSATSTASTCSSRASRSRSTFGKKDAKRHPEQRQRCSRPGYAWAEATSTSSTAIPAERATEPQIVVNGNTALALGVLASGMDICAMYPITPATSASHYLSDVFERVGGIVHQAEDEIAACAFAIGASYAGKCTVTITSGPGYSLKQEAIGLAVMARDPAGRRQRPARRPEHRPADQGRAGRPADGDVRQPRRRAEGGDGGRARIEDCFYSVITARKIAETFNMVVVVLSDAEPRHLAAAVPAAEVQRGLARAADRPDAGPRRRQALRLGPDDRARAPLHPRPAAAACTR